MIFAFALALGIGLLVVAWRLTASRRRQFSFNRAMRNPAVLSAAVWWTRELRKTIKEGASGHPPSSVAQRASTFRSALMDILARNFASNSVALYEDIGPNSNCSSLLQEACNRAGINMRETFHPAIRMRFRNHHVFVSRSGGFSWETVWRK